VLQHIWHHQEKIRVFDIIFIGFQCSDSKIIIWCQNDLSYQLVVAAVFVINGTGYDFYNYYTPPEIKKKPCLQKSENL